MSTLGAQDILLIYCIAIPLVMAIISCIICGVVEAIKNGLDKDLIMTTLGITASSSIMAVGFGMLHCIVAIILIGIVKWVLKLCGIILPDDRVYVAIYIILNIIRNFVFPQKQISKE